MFSVITASKLTQTLSLTFLNFSTTLLLRRFFVYIFIGNDLEALYRLGTVYGAPIGNTKYDKYNDMGRAAQCYRIAAERGHPLACRAWGKFLFKGIGGCSINPGKAWKWYLKASKCGKYKSDAGAMKL